MEVYKLKYKNNYLGRNLDVSNMIEEAIRNYYYTNAEPKIDLNKYNLVTREILQQVRGAITDVIYFNEEKNFYEKKN